MELAGRDAGEHAQDTATLDAKTNIADGGVCPKSSRQTLDTPHAALHDQLTILVREARQFRDRHKCQRNIDMSGRRPLIKGYVAALRLIVGAVMSSA
ncbi:MAG: hypothetical protein WAM29_08235, partial [Methylocella sp.]